MTARRSAGATEGRIRAAAIHAARDLHQLLRNSGVTPPFVLVGVLFWRLHYPPLQPFLSARVTEAAGTGPTDRRTINGTDRKMARICEFCRGQTWRDADQRGKYLRRGADCANFLINSHVCGGGGGSRTRVRKHVVEGPYMRFLSCMFAPDVKERPKPSDASSEKSRLPPSEPRRETSLL